MSKEGILKVAMNLTTQEQKDTWVNVRNHYGQEFSNSAVLYDLVRIKSYQVNGSMSNRDRLDGLDKRVDRIEQTLSLILGILENNEGDGK